LNRHRVHIYYNIIEQALCILLLLFVASGACSMYER